jgi:hypothetical protein
MPIKIEDDLMSLEVYGSVLATARKRGDGWWEVSYSLIRALREELR